MTDNLSRLSFNAMTKCNWIYICAWWGPTYESAQALPEGAGLLGSTVLHGTVRMHGLLIVKAETVVLTVRAASAVPPDS
jgi:hypothetical protein